MAPEARAYTAGELRVGLSAEFTRDISAEDVRRFAEVSGDFNPLHLSETYASETNYGRPIVHGAFQVGLASAMIGMHLPGRSVLLGAVNARFGAPLYYPCSVVVRGEITSWNPQARGGQLRVIVREAARQVPTAEIVMAFTLHESREPASPEAAQRAEDAPGLAAPDARPCVLVTGASGGLGAAAVQRLAERWAVIGLVNRQPLPDEIRALPGVVEIQADLAQPDGLVAVERYLAGRELYGVVHAAWPGAPHGGLLDTPDEVIETQLLFGGAHLVRLARLLYAHAGAAGGRFVAIGSVVGSIKPALTLAAYSLGKNALESGVRLLAPELARRRITINAVCPGFVAVGINRQSNERQQKLEMARVPLGRLCQPDDVIDAVQYFLSPESGFVSGQVLGLTGGQL